MKQLDITHAYNAAMQLNEARFPVSVARSIFDLTEKLRPHFNFHVQEEKKIVSEHPDYDPVNGTISLVGKTEEERQKVIEEANEVSEALKNLCETEVEIDFDPIVISKDIQERYSVELTPRDIGYLKPFITFE